MADFSCYIGIKNNTSNAINLVEKNNSWGYWDQEPPANIVSNDKKTFHLKDKFGPAGTEGFVSYSITDKKGNQGTVKLYFTDPTTGDNKVSYSWISSNVPEIDVNITAHSTDNPEVDGYVQPSGHPIYVDFTISNKTIVEKSKIVVLSDVHIGTNYVSNWYQDSFHQNYLKRVLQYVIDNALEIKELVLLGDIVDFWTFPPQIVPPSFDEMITKNPVIFGKDGMFSKVLDALNGNVTYVLGNHDMGLTQEDLNKIPNPNYKIKFCQDIMYYPLGNDKSIALGHGNYFTIFNQQYLAPQNPIMPLPVGHFVTRSIAYKVAKDLQGTGKTAADLEKSGEPNGIILAIIKEISPYLIGGKSIADFSLSQTLLKVIADATGVQENQVFKISINKTVKDVTLKEALEIYDNLFTEWAIKYGLLYAFKSIMADGDGSYMGWFAQKNAFENNSKLVVMGHTHIPISRLEQSLISYSNVGFNCPAKPDINKNQPTFGVIDIASCKAELYNVINEGNDYKIKPNTLAGTTKVVISPTMDFSSYVIIDNSKGKSDLTLEHYSNNHGDYVVNPPAKIESGKSACFWLQDLPGLAGTEGSVIYKKADNTQITFNYECPFNYLFNNKCSSDGADFYTKSGDKDWGVLNHIEGGGHPFFVKFIVR